MQLLLAFVLGLLVHQNLQVKGLGTGAQSGNLFSLGPVGGAVAKPAGPVFTNVGNYNPNAAKTGFGAVASPGLHGGLGALGFQGLGAKLGGGVPGFGVGGFGQKLGFGGAFGGGHGHGFGAISPSLLGGFKGGLGLQGLGLQGLGLPGGLHGGFPGAGLPGLALPGFGPAGIVGKKEAPLKLTCLNVELQKTPYGPRKSAIAATIMKNRDGDDGYGDFSHGFDLHDGPKRSLSLDLSVKVEGQKGPAKVVFTKTAAISGGCNPHNLGGVFTGEERDDPFGKLFGQSFLSGGYGDNDYDDDGVVTTLSIYPDRPTSAHKDKLDIDKLEHLAGRGLAVVTGLTEDGYGKQTIDGEVLACCALAYDDQPRSLHSDPGHATPAYPNPQNPPQVYPPPKKQPQVYPPPKKQTPVYPPPKNPPHNGAPVPKEPVYYEGPPPGYKPPQKPPPYDGRPSYDGPAPYDGPYDPKAPPYYESYDDPYDGPHNGPPPKKPVYARP